MIKTTNKKEFLASESKEYKRNIKGTLGHLAVKCEDCGIYYWHFCKKRCDCETK